MKLTPKQFRFELVWPLKTHAYDNTHSVLVNYKNIRIYSTNKNNSPTKLFCASELTTDFFPKRSHQLYTFNKRWKYWDSIFTPNQNFVGIIKIKIRYFSWTFFIICPWSELSKPKFPTWAVYLIWIIITLRVSVYH